MSYGLSWNQNTQVRAWVVNIRVIYELCDSRGVSVPRPSKLMKITVGHIAKQLFLHCGCHSSYRYTSYLWIMAQLKPKNTSYGLSYTYTGYIWVICDSRGVSVPKPSKSMKITLGNTSQKLFLRFDAIAHIHIQAIYELWPQLEPKNIG